MQSQVSLTQKIIYCLEKTHSSSSTKQVQSSIHQLLTIFRNQKYFKKFIPTIQSILKSNNTHQIKLSADNIIQFIAQSQIYQFQNKSAIAQLFIGYKSFFVNHLNQIIKDSNISYVYKHSSIKAYINITLLQYGQNNCEKIIRDLQFYYQTQQYMLAALMTNYLIKNKNLKFKQQNDIYQRTMPKLLDKLSKLLQNYYTKGNIQNQILKQIQFIFQLVHTIIINMDFSLRFKPVEIILKQKNTLNILQFLCIQLCQKHILSNDRSIQKQMYILIRNDTIRRHKQLSYQIIDKIIRNGFKINLQKSCSQQMKRIVKIVKQSVKYIENEIRWTNYEYNNSKVNRLIICCIRVISGGISTKLQLCVNKVDESEINNNQKNINNNNNKGINNKQQIETNNNNKNVQRIDSLIDIKWLMSAIMYLIVKLIKDNLILKEQKEDIDINNHNNEYNEFFNFWQDITNLRNYKKSIQSQTIQAQMTNLLITIIQNNPQQFINNLIQVIKPYCTQYELIQNKEQQCNKYVSLFKQDNPFITIINKKTYINYKKIYTIQQTITKYFILLIPSLALKVFIKYIHLQKLLQTIILNNYQQMFKLNYHKQTINQYYSIQDLIIFLILIDSYNDDILQQLNSQNLYLTLINQAFKLQQYIQNAHQHYNFNLLSTLFNKLIKNYFNYNFPYQTQKSKIQCFLTNINQKESLSMTPILSIIIKNYSSQITSNFMTNLIQKIIIKLMKNIQNINKIQTNNTQQILKASNRLKKLYSHTNQILINLLPQFFAVQQYKSYFQQLLNNIKQFLITISQPNSLNINFKLEFQNIFPFLKRSIKVLKHIPNGYQKLLYQCDPLIQDEQSVQAINLLIVYANPENLQLQFFINKILKQCVQHLKKTVIKCKQTKQIQKRKNQTKNQNQNKQLDLCELHCLLLLHLGIFYHHQKFETQFIQDIILMIQLWFRTKSKKFDFVSGKYQLIMILLIRYEFQRVHMILKKCSQIQIKRNNQYNLKLNSQNQQNPQFVQANIYELIYNVIYYQQNAYRIQYDSLVFVTCQLQILQNYLKPNQQQSQMLLKYAHISLLAIIYNLQRIFKRNIQKDYASFLTTQQQQQQTILPKTYIQKNLSKTIQIIQKMHFPLKFKTQYTDQFNLFNNFLKKLFITKQGCQWYKIMIQKYLSENTIKTLQKMRQYKKVNGHYRKIVSVRKNLKIQHNQPKYQNQRKLLD